MRCAARPRHGAAMVAVMLMGLILGMLVTAMLIRTRGSRHRLERVEDRLQRELALDSAFVHAFHQLKQLELPPSGGPLPLEPLPPGAGEVAGVPYGFRFSTSRATGSVRIDVQAGENPALEGYAVAMILDETTEQGGRRRRWYLRYEGGEPAETSGLGLAP